MPLKALFLVLGSWEQVKQIGSWGHFSFSELGANTPLEGYTAAELHFCKIMSSHDASDIYF